MNHRVTLCPRCGTSFRVTEPQLAAASGAVRCGSCLYIFNARRHWADEPPPEPTAADTTPAPPIVDPLAAASLAAPSIPADLPVFAAPTAGPAPAATPSEPDHADAAASEEDDEDADAYWAGRLLDDDPAPPVGARPAGPGDAHPDSGPEAPGDGDGDGEKDAARDASPDDPASIPEAAGAGPVLPAFETEPLQFQHHPARSRRHALLWGAGGVLALAGLLGQYLYFNFDALAKGPLRPQVAGFCQLLRCELPAQVDTGRIRTGSLMVRSHPERANALAVDAIITNQAAFPQPFPLLQLQFTDLDGAPVAARRFEPAEYLAGELSGARLMPVQQPVHIALALIDPGPRAVNYRLTVVPRGPAPAGQ